MYYIYIHKNLTNGKVYIGQTSQDSPNKRWGIGGKGYKDNPRFFADITLYGWDGFSHNIITTVPTKEEADKVEQFYIRQYNSCDPKYGYNRTGDGKRHNEKDIISSYYNDKAGKLRSIKTSNSLAADIEKYRRKMKKS